ncbi:serine hydrolase domain-containing protein [Bacteroidota bacterium]
MKKLNILYILSLIIFYIFSLSSCKVKNDNTDPSTQEIIDQTVQTIRVGVETEIGKTIPTLNIFIQTPNGTWFSSSAGAGYQPITADTYFRFASNTKNFTASAILNMMEDGWLDLDALITDTIPGSNISYVPATAEWNFPYKSQITIKMLLNHSAGVYDVDNDSVPGYQGNSYTQYTQNVDPNHQFTTAEMVNQLVIHNLFYFKPGTNKRYSNTGYAIAGEIVERVYSFHTGSQKTLTDYLHDYVYGFGTPVPLKVHFPYLASDQDLPTPYSCGHKLLDGTNVDEICSYNMSAQVAEGNGYSTMRELNTWIRTNLKGENVLTPASVELMKFSVSMFDANYGLGCFYKQNLGYGHNGSRIGNLSLMMYDPLTDVSLVTYISANNEENFIPTYLAIEDLAYGVRTALGYPGKP